MASFANTQGITKIILTQNVQCFCPLGDDWYTNHITIELIPKSIIPDYCEADDFIRGLAGQSLIIEDVIDKIFTYFKQSYDCSYVKVVSYVDDAKHLAVTVVKEDN